MRPSVYGKQTNVAPQLTNRHTLFCNHHFQQDSHSSTLQDPLRPTASPQEFQEPAKPLEIMTSSSATAEAQIKSEIERLTGMLIQWHQKSGIHSTTHLLRNFTATINLHKAHQQKKPWGHGGHYSPYPQANPRNNAYVNPNHKPANKYVRPGLNPAGPVRPASTNSTISTSTSTPQASTPGTPAGPSTSTTPVPASSRPSSTIGGETKEVVLGGVAFESSARSLVRKDCEYLVTVTCKVIILYANYVCSTENVKTCIHWQTDIDYATSSSSFFQKAWPCPSWKSLQTKSPPRTKHDAE